MKKKKFQNFFFGVKKSKKNFQFYDVKSTEIFIFDIQIVEKCLVRGVLTNFIRKVPFWGPYIPLKQFSYLPPNLSCRGASFEHPYDHILSDDFLTKKSGKIGQNSKILLKSS